MQQSLVIGDTDIGLYLKIAAGAHLGIAFSPFFLAGRLYLDGELRLFIVSVEAHGHFDVEAPDPTYIHGEICGKVDFFFFDVKGCVAFSIGDSERQLPAPPLVKNVFLQSHAPVIAAGQGGDRPIDASLGDAVMLANGTVPAGAEIPTVPIDTVPVLQLHASPLINADNTPTATFTNNLTTPPGLTGGGWVNVGGGRQVQYKLREIALNPPPPASPEKPPATWRRDRAPGREGIDTNIDLALFSRVPMTASRAVERSTELHGIVTTRWSGLCDPIAPEACVLSTFCEQPFGPSEAGWHLKGIPEPDPPGTQRHSPPPTDLYVESPTGEPGSDLLDVLVADGVGALLTPAKVIGLNTDLPDPNFDLGCFRALQLPMTSQQDASGTALPNPQDADDYADKLSNNRWVTFHTGAAESATFFLAFSRQYSEAGRITVRELDAEGTVRREASLFDLPFQQVTGVTNGLPSEWTDPNGPWYDQVLPVATFLADEQFSALIRAVVQLKPIEGCERIQLVTASTADDLEENRVIVGVVEVCSTEERDRVLEGESIQTGEMQTLTDYLTGGDVVPLLAPNQTYTLTVRYDAVSKAQDGSESTEANLQQQFRFHTDAAVPERLDPWVLGMTPDPDEMYHFYADPIQVVFNDLSVIQLFSAYGKNLRFSVRGADGVAVTIDPPLIEALDPVSSELSTPLRELLKALIDGGFLPCMGQTEIPLPPHGSATVPVTLRPLMAYTFDIEVQPPHVSGNGEAVRPLFRRSFSTSKFPNLKALVEEVRARRIRHRVLASQLTDLPVGAPVAVASDQDIQDALVNAGEQALPAPSSTGVTIYWARRSGETSYSPHAILIDAAEPLWRTRVEPRLETVPDQDDPAFQRVVLQNVPAMEVIEQSPLGAHVTHFVRSPSGTRILAVMSETFNPPAAGEDVVLAVHRLASSLYGTPEDTEVLLDIPLGPRAPWEEDEE